MKIDFNNERPIYLQLVEYIKLEIISGRLNNGERLPSVRDYALQMKVNPNTMQKALSELENDKLIYTESTNGRFVTNDIKKINKIKNEYVKEKTKLYIDDMKEIGLKKDDIISHLENF